MGAVWAFSVPFHPPGPGEPKARPETLSMLAVTPSPVPDRGPLSPRRSLGILTPNPSLPPVSPPTPKLTTCRPGPRSLCRVVPRPPGCQPTSCPSVSAVPVAQLRPGPPPASTGPVSGSSGDPGPGSFTSGLLVPHLRRGRGAGRGQSGVRGGRSLPVARSCPPEIPTSGTGSAQTRLLATCSRPRTDTCSAVMPDGAPRASRGRVPGGAASTGLLCSAEQLLPGHAAETVAGS